MIVRLILGYIAVNDDNY